jgi:FkbM family methyltransferase
MVKDQLKSYSQFDEDRILYDIFKHQLHGYCVEVGAYDGITGSPTYLFEKLKWTCLLVEANPELVEQIKKNRKCVIKNYAASDKEGDSVFFVAEKVEQMSTLTLTKKHHDWILEVGGTVREINVQKKTLDHILIESGFQEVQFVVIDVEGYEMEVLKGFTIEKFKPRIVIIEDNSNQEDSSVPQYMEKRGYVNFKRTGVNDWYARENDSVLIDMREVLNLIKARKRAKIRYHFIKTIGPLKPYLPRGLKRGAKKVVDWIVRGI